MPSVCCCVTRRCRTNGEVADVLIRHGLIAEIESRLEFVSIEERGIAEVDAQGGALLPGLHDHHIHLFATAAAADSVQCGPPAVRNRDELAAALRQSRGDGWLRGVGYDESVAGPLDREVLDALGPDRPVRVQHRGGSLWSLNSAAVEELELENVQLAGVERDAAGRPTGRLWRMDDWLRHALEARDGRSAPNLLDLGTRLASYGITGVTDATPAGGLRRLWRRGAVRAMPQRVFSIGTRNASLGQAPVKIVVPDHALPGIDELAALITAAHAQDRPVALHSVTRESLLLVLAAFDEVASFAGDRIEHAAVCPPEAIERLLRHGLTVVTQPSLIAQRGDDYLDQVDRDDVDNLWRYGSLIQAGIHVGCSSDAPYGDLDPWASIRAAAATRTTHRAVASSARTIASPPALPWMAT